VAAQWQEAVMAGHDKRRVCGNCGFELTSTARFCSNCGEAQGDLRPRADTGLLPANRKLNGDRYLIIRKLAQGGQSAVYLAMDSADGRRVAIKEMSGSQLTPPERPKAVNDFLREANILMGLSHAGLCRVFATFLEDGNKPFLVMEYIEGHNLEDELIGRGRPLDWQSVATWGMMLADVLGYLHGQNPPVIYRDLKPANVMLLRTGAIKLIDFGIARQLYPARLRDTARLGTDGYAPLEQYSGHSETRSDVYALGASLYHLLTGRVPEAAPLRYTGQTLTPIRALNPEVPEAMDRVVGQMMHLDARKRLPDARAARHALEWACRAASQPGMGGSPGPISGSRPSARPGAPIWGAAGPQGAPPQAPSLPIDEIATTDLPPNPPSSSQPPSPLDPLGLGGVNSDTQSGFAASPQYAPKLRLWPLRLDAGLVQANSAPSMKLDLSNRGGGHLTGIVETNSTHVTVDPPRVDPNTSQLVVHINTGGLAPGEYRVLVAVRTNGGDQVVPVQFMVGPAGAAGGWAGQRA
jgi:serine/threonine-protein kinase